jgi:hypothetical protein
MWMMRQLPSPDVPSVSCEFLGPRDDQIVQIVCGFEIGSACLLQNTTMYKTLGPSNIHDRREHSTAQEGG